MSAPGTRLEIGELVLEVPAMPGIDPGLFVRHLELGLRRMALTSGRSAAIARLSLAPVAARRGDTAVTLAGRVSAAIASELQQRLDGGRT